MGRVVRFGSRRGRGGRLWLQAAAVFGLAFVVVLNAPERLAVQAGVPPVEAPASRAEGAPNRADIAGRPSRITDGDTIRFGETRVRLHGVDAPEMRTEEGREARRRLIALIGDGQVRCRDTGQRSYDRVVAVCFDARGRDLAAAMVQAGWAVDAPRFSGGRYAAYQRRAEAAGAGLFGR